MAHWLYRIGEMTFEHRKKTILIWIATLLVAAAVGVGLGASFSGDLSIPGTKSEEALKIMEREFSATEQEATDRANLQLMFKAPDGQKLESSEAQAAIRGALDLIRKDSSVESIAGPFDNGSIGAAGTIGYATVAFTVASEEAADRLMLVVGQAAEAVKDEGLQAEFVEYGKSEIPEIGGTSEVIGIVIAFFILAFTFGSFLAAGLPILTAVFGLGVGIMLVLIGTNFMEIASISITLAVMLGLAVGIDYALFLISRYRQNLADGMDIKQAVAIANATAGSSILFAGLTVIIALLGLAVVRIPFLTAMGGAAAAAVAVAVVVAVTLVPAVLGLAGERLRPKGKPMAKQEHAEKRNAWGNLLAKYPLPITIAAVLLLLFVSIPALHIQTGLPDDGMKSTETPERRIYDLRAEAYGPGYNGPLVILVQANEEGTQETIREAVTELKELDNVAYLSEPQLNATGSTAMVQMLPGTGPNHEETKELVQDIRDYSSTLEKAGKAEVMVTGATAINIDISEMLNGALVKFALLIVGLALILLGLVFRSIWIPIKAVLGYLLTLSATLGFVVFVLQDGHLAGLFGIPEPGPVLNFLPILTAGILFGLAMDYEVFLVSRMREEYSRSGDGRKAVLAGIKNSGSVVTAAGLIMVVVFASFVFVEDPMIKSMGLALAFGILVDAFIVRMTIVPAIMIMASRSVWYFPRWLDRITPKIDVEGENIVHKEMSS